MHPSGYAVRVFSVPEVQAVRALTGKGQASAAPRPVGEGEVGEGRVGEGKARDARSRVHRAARVAMAVIFEATTERVKRPRRRRSEQARVGLSLRRACPGPREAGPHLEGGGSCAGSPRSATVPPMLDRSLVVVRAREPLLHWLRSLPDPEDESTTLETLNEDPSAYLVPVYDDDEERDDILRQAYDIIFEDQLAGWWTAEADWPQERTFEMFQAWFDVEWHSTVEDLVDAPIRDE